MRNLMQWVVRWGHTGATDNALRAIERQRVDEREVEVALVALARRVEERRAA